MTGTTASTSQRGGDAPRGGSTDETDSSVLRSRIKAEGLRVPADLRRRSTGRIVASALRPFILIGGSLAAGRWAPGPWFWWLPAHFVLLLGAHRSFMTLVHDASHKLYAANTKRNDLIANVAAAGFIGMVVQAYRVVHLRHHAFNGSDLDPEHVHFETIARHGGIGRYAVRSVVGGRILELARKYYLPSDPGVDNGAARTSDAGDVDPSAGTVEEGSPPGRNLLAKWPIVVCQLALISAFALLAGRWYLYLVWVYLAVTWSPLLSSLRFVVEHPGRSDHTVSTTSFPGERDFFAPYNFNYHMEHHLWPSIPPYRLRQVHRYLRGEGYYRRHPDSLNTSYLGALTRTRIAS